LLDTCPGLIAASHVLLRLSTPRHPPYTLSNLTISIFDCIGLCSLSYRSYCKVFRRKIRKTSTHLHINLSKNLFALRSEHKTQITTHFQNNRPAKAKLGATTTTPTCPASHTLRRGNLHSSLNRRAKTGDDRGRTGNLRLAKPALSQLSYVPEPKQLIIDK
jgi:hypothetical protein